MNRIQRCLGVLATLGGALLALAAAAPAALASLPPPDPGPAGVVPASVAGTVVAGGMPGWQIALIAAGAALFAAAAAVMADRARAARRHVTAPSA
jgi:cell division protein FtsW (lipid II flippase)